jgi:glutamine phosphoribosylpyrophosphate amidotransferase
MWSYLKGVYSIKIITPEELIKERLEKVEEVLNTIAIKKINYMRMEKLAN